MNITEILETQKVVSYLQERQLLKQYKKAKNYLLEGFKKQVKFKLRKPKEQGIYSFRINKQFRALGVYTRGELRIFKIDNHQ